MSDDERKLIRGFGLMTLKPTMYIANVAEDGFENNPHLEAVKKLAAEENAIVVPLCNQIEAEISLLEDEDRAEFLEAMGMEEPGLNVVIRAGYKLLGLQTYFTAGVQEVRAWTVKVGAQRLLKQLVLFILISKKALSVLKLLHMMTSYNTTVKTALKSR